MPMPIDFSAFHRATWRDGELPKAATGDTVVSHDQRNRAYAIDADDEAAFFDWVADLWQSDHDPREDDEPAAAYLDRRGITVRATQ